jgi:hypothetical protein
MKYLFVTILSLFITSQAIGQSYGLVHHPIHNIRYSDFNLHNDNIISSAGKIVSIANNETGEIDTIIIGNIISYNPRGFSVISEKGGSENQLMVYDHNKNTAKQISEGTYALTDNLFINTRNDSRVYNRYGAIKATLNKEWLSVHQHPGSRFLATVKTADDIYGISTELGLQKLPINREGILDFTDEYGVYISDNPQYMYDVLYKNKRTEIDDGYNYFYIIDQNTIAFTKPGGALTLYYPKEKIFEKIYQAKENIIIREISGSGQNIFWLEELNNRIIIGVCYNRSNSIITKIPVSNARASDYIEHKSGAKIFVSQPWNSMAQIQSTATVFGKDGTYCIQLESDKDIFELLGNKIFYTENKILKSFDLTTKEKMSYLSQVKGFRVNDKNEFLIILSDNKVSGYDYQSNKTVFSRNIEIDDIETIYNYDEYIYILYRTNSLKDPELLIYNYIKDTIDYKDEYTLTGNTFDGIEWDSYSKNTTPFDNNIGKPIHLRLLSDKYYTYFHNIEQSLWLNDGYGNDRKSHTRVRDGYMFYISQQNTASEIEYPAKLIRYDIDKGLYDVLDADIFKDHGSTLSSMIRGVSLDGDAVTYTRSNGMVTIKEYKDLVPTSIGVDQYDNKEQVGVYPNPASDKVNIGTDKRLLNAKVVSINGKSISLTVSENTIDVNPLAEGSYILILEFKNDIQVSNLIIRYD